jgi:hypothetical protein
MPPMAGDMSTDVRSSPLRDRHCDGVAPEFLPTQPLGELRRVVCTVRDQAVNRILLHWRVSRRLH